MARAMGLGRLAIEQRGADVAVTVAIMPPGVMCVLPVLREDLLEQAVQVRGGIGLARGGGGRQ